MKTAMLCSHPWQMLSKAVLSRWKSQGTPPSPVVNFNPYLTVPNSPKLFFSSSWAILSFQILEMWLCYQLAHPKAPPTHGDPACLCCTLSSSSLRPNVLQSIQKVYLFSKSSPMGRWGAHHTPSDLFTWNENLGFVNLFWSDFLWIKNKLR